MEVVSGSQLDAHARCRRKYYYAHDLHLQPEVMPTAIAVGRAGHALLKSYYRALQAGADHRDAIQQAEQSASWTMTIEDDIEAEEADRALNLVRLYWAGYPSDARRYQVIEVEQEHRVPIGNVIYAFTVDLLLYDRDNGHYVLMDHRFLGDPYDQELATIDPQLPRYVIGLTQQGVAPTEAIRNMVSTKKRSKPTAANTLRRTNVPITPARLDNAMRQLNAGILDLTTWRSMDLASREYAALRTWDAGSCRWCPFLEPCSVSVTGEDTTFLLAAKFKRSDYGYS